MGPVEIITIQNPPFNVLITPVLDGLVDAFSRASQDPSVRCIILTGAGEKAFTCGANIREMVKKDVQGAKDYSAKGQSLTNLIEHISVPVILAVRGFCLGGGCEISLACDFIIASDDAVFAQPEINIGVLPGWGGSRRLPRVIGVARARQWIFTGEMVPAQEAFKQGLVYKVVPREKLMYEALSFACILSSKAAVALAMAKFAVNQALDASRLMGLEYERDLWGILFSTGDQKEGMTAFLEKRKAAFNDRAEWDKRTKGYAWRQWEAHGSAPDGGRRQPEMAFLENALPEGRAKKMHRHRGSA
jgi:enoyl-CoA hydratase